MLGLVSWNIRYFSHGTKGITSTEKTLRSIANVLTSISPQPDLIALQEIDDWSIRSGLARAGIRKRQGLSRGQFQRFVECINLFAAARGDVGYNAVFFPAHGHNRKVRWMSTGLATLYRRDLKCVAHNGDAPCDITHRRIQRFAKMKQTRICAWCQFETPTGDRLDLFNTHLSLPAFFKRASGPTGGRFGEADNQVREVDSLLSFVRQTAPVETTIIAGDFNARPGSRVYEHVLMSGDFKDAQAHLLNATPAEMNGIASAGFMNFKARIDHVFSGDQIEFSSFEHTAPYGKAHPWRKLSDHSPLVGRFGVSTK